MGDAMNSRGIRVSGAMASVALVAACGFGGTSQGGLAAAPSASVAQGASADPQPAVPAATPSPTASLGPTPSPSPSVESLTADDLALVMPSIRQMTKVQGSTFKAEPDFPNWTNSVPLPRAQAGNIRFGENRAVLPARCSSVTVLNGNGFLWDDAKAPFVTAASFSNRRNTNQFLGNDRLYVWQSVAYVMQPGAAAQWVVNAAARRDGCKEYRTISRSGDVEDASWSKSKAVRSGNLIASRGIPSGSQPVEMFMMEAIGDVLTTTYLQADKDLLLRASEVYNTMADALAKRQGVTRPPVDLASMKSDQSDPATYAEIERTSRDAA
ncbi:unannotated protein [freshwater metagenome]|uniref:Unannotated protein n=1 Tax=freshwater metagenome TaxID=449393 RepID=A0A6J7CQY1_9ZZZZ